MGPEKKPRENLSQTYRKYPETAQKPTILVGFRAHSEAAFGGGGPIQTCDVPLILLEETLPVPKYMMGLTRLPLTLSHGSPSVR